MSLPQALLELFLPLGNRLYYFESGKYVRESRAVIHPEIDGYITFAYHSLMDEIGKRVNVFSPEQAYRLSTDYLRRVQSLIPKIEDVQFETVEYEGTDVVLRGETNAEQKKAWRERISRELSYYENGLQSIIDTRKNSTIDEDKFIKGRSHTEINLPENFETKELQKHFDPTLNKDEIALLFYILKDRGIIPPYSDTSLSVLLSPLFGRSKQDIRQSLGVAGSSLKSNKAVIKSLKDLLSFIIVDLEKKPK